MMYHDGVQSIFVGIVTAQHIAHTQIERLIGGLSDGTIRQFRDVVVGSPEAVVGVVIIAYTA